MSGSVVITADEIARGMQQYEASMRELAALLNAPRWSTVGVAFGCWSNERPEPWQISFVLAKRYIAKYGRAPWYDESCSCDYCVSVRQ